MTLLCPSYSGRGSTVPATAHSMLGPSVAPPTMGWHFYSVEVDANEHNYIDSSMAWFSMTSDLKTLRFMIT